MAKLVRRQIHETDATIVSLKKKKECWPKTATLDTKLHNVPQTNKTIVFAVIFLLDTNHFHLYCPKPICTLSVSCMLTPNFTMSRP